MMAMSIPTSLGLTPDCQLQLAACSFGWWLMAGAGLF
jgi:hypothetical protein